MKYIENFAEKFIAALYVHIINHLSQYSDRLNEIKMHLQN